MRARRGAAKRKALLHSFVTDGRRICVPASLREANFFIGDGRITSLNRDPATPTAIDMDPHPPLRPRLPAWAIYSAFLASIGSTA